MRKAMLFLAGIGFAVSASAHDLWVQPGTYWPTPGAPVPMVILTGHGTDRENWGIRSDRIILLRNIAPDGTGTDLRQQIRPRSADPSMTLRFARPGTHVLVMQSSHAESNLPGARFNEFLAEEGLTPAIQHRARTRTSNRPGREIYSRRAKMLVQVGPPSARTGSRVTRPLGLDLEIVPERNPYLLSGSERLPVRVYFHRRPLAGALVKLTNLDSDARPVEMHRTDRSGRASFRVPRRGKWLLNVVWTQPITGNPSADFDTTFSSLTFGYPN